MITKSETALNHDKLKLAPYELRWECPTNFFHFETTKNIEPLDRIIGQPRAIEALKLGSELQAKGYNMFVTGLSGTGRLTTVKRILEDITTECPITFDYCYVNNFNDPDAPLLIILPRGLGKKFAAGMNDTIAFLLRRLPKLFEEEAYLESKKKIVDEYQQKERDLLKGFDEKIKPQGFIRGQLQNEQGIAQPEVFPVVEGKPMQIDAVDELVEQGKLPLEKANDIREKWEDYHGELLELARAGMKIMQEFRKALYENDKANAQIVVTSALEEVKSLNADEKFVTYIHDVRSYILENLGIFIQRQVDPLQLPTEPEDMVGSDKFNVFRVNVILDNSDTVSAPVIIETNPNFTNLFGTVEKLFDQRGFWRTDFTKIKAGSLLKADQGFLIVNANDLFIEPGVWNYLKRVLLNEKLEIQPLDTVFQISQSHLKPEPIKVNVKVIIIGGHSLYTTLYHYEKGFKKIFKVNAQFDYETEISEELIMNYAHFAAKISYDEGLPHCTPDGIAALVEWAVEYAGSKSRISLKFSDVADVLREAAHYGRESHKNYIDREIVEMALDRRRYRSNLTDEKIKRQIIEGNMLIATEGERIGQINGLTIYSNGLISFGKPARITATVSAGNTGIINIEREADLSGSIHNKGVLIISGFLRDKFAKKKPLTLTASLAFEQSYGGVDGDSASCAEIAVILSAITNVPIKQNFAITGSVNQKGDVQPIGGVNDKIRGFWEVCQDRGFTGIQGVIIPKQNVKDLMLCKEIIQSVEEGNFHIYAISNIDEAVNLLMGMPAGQVDAKGAYPEGTLYGLVVEKLEQFYQLSKDEKIVEKMTQKVNVKSDLPDSDEKTEEFIRNWINNQKEE
ncbi:MAG: Lon protease family protein [Chloroflexota bacterium]